MRQNHTQDLLIDDEMIEERMDYADLEYCLKGKRHLKKSICQ